MSDTPKPNKLTITAEVPDQLLREFLRVLMNFHPTACNFWVVTAGELKVDEVEKMFESINMESLSYKKN